VAFHRGGAVSMVSHHVSGETSRAEGKFRLGSSGCRSLSSVLARPDRGSV
jgi:hypothetical protein